MRGARGLLLCLCACALCVCARGGGSVYNGQAWVPAQESTTRAAPPGESARDARTGEERINAEATGPGGGPRPFPPRTDSWRDPNATLFLGIAAFRDVRCGRTLKNVFTKAKFPQRIYVGVVQQRLPNDADCLQKYCELMKELGHTPCPHLDQIRNLRVSAREARGPTYGRYLQTHLMRDEEFCMQTDSHMDFSDDFDVKLMDMWGLTQNEYAVLSTYVHDFPTLGKNINNRHEVPHLCQIMWQGGMVRNQQAKAAINLDKPILAPLWGAGLSFSKCHAERKTKYDPHLPQIFDGEEFSKFARLWTRGYDVYSPHRSVVVHDYSHPKDHNPLGWSRDMKEYRQSFNRLLTLLGLPGGDRSTTGMQNLGRYGLGTKRSLDELIAFTHIDLRNRKVVGNSCGALQWVPFDPDPDPEVETGDLWGTAPYRVNHGSRHVPVALSPEEKEEKKGKQAASESQASPGQGQDAQAAVAATAAPQQ